MKKGNKPSFHGAQAGERAKTLYQSFVDQLRKGYEHGIVADGVFQAMMEVALVNDGPVTEASRTAPAGCRRTNRLPGHNRAQYRSEATTG